jgi:hypothetical protein
MLENLGGDLRLDFYHGRIFFSTLSRTPNPKISRSKDYAVKKKDAAFIFSLHLLRVWPFVPFSLFFHYLFS